MHNKDKGIKTIPRKKKLRQIPKILRAVNIGCRTPQLQFYCKCGQDIIVKPNSEKPQLMPANAQATEIKPDPKIKCKVPEVLFPEGIHRTILMSQH